MLERWRMGGTEAGMPLDEEGAAIAMSLHWHQRSWANPGGGNGVGA